MALPTALHKLASPLLYYSGAYRQGWRARYRRRQFSFAVVYHRVVADDSAGQADFGIERGVPASVFERQMRFLRRHFEPVKSSQIQQFPDDAARFAVTLDDGYEDNYRIAAPILKKLGIPATFFVVSEFVGTDRLFWWEQVAELMRGSERPEIDLRVAAPGLCQDDSSANVFSLRNRDECENAYNQVCARIRRGRHADVDSQLAQLEGYFDAALPSQGRRFGLMDWEQLRDLIGQGFEIGGHTANHCNVVGADEAMLQRELIDSLNLLESRLDTPVESFAYPYGMFESSSLAVAERLAVTHCKAAFTTVRQVVEAGTPRYELPRFPLNRGYHFACAYNLQTALAETSPRPPADHKPRG